MAGAAGLALMAAAPVSAHHDPGPADNVAVVDGRPLLLSLGGSGERVELRSLEYYATRDGGFRAAGEYLVTVQRDGVSTRHAGVSCAERGVIRSGDLVRVEVRRGAVLAGSRYGC